MVKGHGIHNMRLLAIFYMFNTLRIGRSQPAWLTSWIWWNVSKGVDECWSYCSKWRTRCLLGSQSGDAVLNPLTRERRCFIFHSILFPSLTLCVAVCFEKWVGNIKRSEMLLEWLSGGHTGVVWCWLTACCSVEQSMTEGSQSYPLRRWRWKIRATEIACSWIPLFSDLWRTYQGKQSACSGWDCGDLLASLTCRFGIMGHHCYGQIHSRLQKCQMQL